MFDKTISDYVKDNNDGTSTKGMVRSILANPDDYDKVKAAFTEIFRSLTTSVGGYRGELVSTHILIWIRLPLRLLMMVGINIAEKLWRIYNGDKNHY